MHGFGVVQSRLDLFEMYSLLKYSFIEAIPGEHVALVMFSRILKVNSRKRGNHMIFSHRKLP